MLHKRYKTDCNILYKNKRQLLLTSILNKLVLTIEGGIRINLRQYYTLLYINLV